MTEIAAPRKFYKWTSSGCVETTKDDPERFVSKEEIEKRAIVSLFIGIGAGLVVQRLLAGHGGLTPAASRVRSAHFRTRKT